MLDGVAPTLASVRDGSYRLSRPLQWIWLAKSPAADSLATHTADPVFREQLGEEGVF